MNSGGVRTALPTEGRARPSSPCYSGSSFPTLSNAAVSLGHMGGDKSPSAGASGSLDVTSVAALPVSAGQADGPVGSSVSCSRRPAAQLLASLLASSPLDGILGKELKQQRMGPREPCPSA